MGFSLEKGCDQNREIQIPFRVKKIKLFRLTLHAGQKDLRVPTDIELCMNLPHILAFEVLEGKNNERLQLHSM